MVTIMKSPSFVILGGAGKIAKYHFEAIEKVGGEVVGVIDPGPTKFRPPVDIKYWYTNREIYGECNPNHPEYFVILSPNHLHVEHSTWALKYGDVICEKPLAISTSELAHLKSEESLGQTKVYPIMQMRKHPMLAALHKEFQERPPTSIEIRYRVKHPLEFYKSWQGEEDKAGGIIFHLGIHMLDFLAWTFDNPTIVEMVKNEKNSVMCRMRMGTIPILFDFSSYPEVFPMRTLTFDGYSVDLSYPFPLHTLAYQDIISGHPLSIPDLEPTIKLCEEIRNYK